MSRAAPKLKSPQGVGLLVSVIALYRADGLSYNEARDKAETFLADFWRQSINESTIEAFFASLDTEFGGLQSHVAAPDPHPLFDDG